MGEKGKKEDGTFKAVLTVLAAVLCAMLLPVIVIAVIICSLGRREADYNAEVAKALFAGREWPASLGTDVDMYYAKIQSELENLTDEWLSLHKGDDTWKSDDHEEESLLMRVCFYVIFYKNDCTFTKEDYKAFARIFDDADTVNEAFQVLGLFYRDFGDAEQKAVRDCAFLVAADAVPPPEADVSPPIGKWQPQEDWSWTDLPSNEDGPEAVKKARSRMGDPYSSERKGIGRYVDCGWLAKWAWGQVGVTIPSTAAEQARYLKEQGRNVSRMKLKKGDLIFWSHGPNGEYRNVTHVGIYAGDGRVIHASWSEGRVVESFLFDEDKIVLCGRPAERNGD